MGNQSKETPNDKVKSEKYLTSAGVEVDTQGHIREWMSDFEDEVIEWVECGGASPDEEMEKDQIDFILDNMEDSENNPEVPYGFLTRAEHSHHLLEKLWSGEVGVGDLLPDKATFRSYGRSPDATIQYMHGWEDDSVIIYGTNNNTKHFNATNWCDTFSSEKESFVEQGKMRIDNITSLSVESSR